MSTPGSGRTPAEPALPPLSAVSDLMAGLGTAGRDVVAVRTAVRWLLETLRADTCVALGVTEIIAVAGTELGASSEALVRRHGAEPTAHVDLEEIGPVELLTADVGIPPILRLAVLRDRRDPFTGDDVQLLGLCADALTMAIRLLDRGVPDGRPVDGGGREQRLLETVLRAQRLIIRRAPLDQVLTGLMVGARNLMAGDTASLHLIDPALPGTLVMTASAGPAGPFRELLDRTLIGEGACGRAVQDNRMIVLNDYPSGGGFPELVRIGVSAAIATPVYSDEGVIGGLVVTARDPARRFSEEDQRIMRTFADNVSLAMTDARTLERMDHALRDHLTGLPGRILLLERIELALQQVRRHGGTMAVLFCDLDDFKEVNDTLGHAAGDELLCVVARRLRDSIRTGDFAARLGGDEFAVVLEKLDADETRVIVDRVLAAVSAPIQLGKHRLSVGISIGVADAGRTGITTEDLLHAADLAMYSAKRAGGRTSSGT